MWAHLDKHASLDEPPDKPFFRGCKRPTNELDAPNSTKTHIISNSPGQKVLIRTELIDQLEKLNQLCVSSVIDENEYQDLRKTISDIKDL